MLLSRSMTSAGWVLITVGWAATLALTEHGLGEPQSPQQSNYWTVVYNGKTVRSWYEIVMDKHRDKLQREDAVTQLGHAGSAGIFALTQLLTASDTDSVTSYGSPWSPNAVQPGFVRMHAAEMLGAVKATSSAPELARVMLNDSVADVRVVAAVALSKLGSSDQGVVNALKQVLGGNNYCVWPGAVVALAQVQPRDTQISQLLSRIASKDPMSARDNLSQTCIVNARTEARRAR